jgi:hypothetical protein
MKLEKRTIGIVVGSCVLMAAAALSINFYPNTVTTRQVAPAVIDQGGGAVTTGAYKLINGSCRYAMAKPMTFRNSGEQSVTLEQLARPLGIKPVYISGENAEVYEGSIEPQVFLTPEYSSNQLGLTAAELSKQRTFIPSFQRIGDQIEPGETYTVYLVIIIDISPDFSSFGVLAATVRVDAIFSNNQISTIEESIPISRNVLENCS